MHPPKMITVFNLYLFCITFLFSYMKCNARNITCTEFFSNMNDETIPILVHVLASDNQEDINYFWSTYKIPSVIIARTVKGTTVSIDKKKLERFESGAISFNEKPLAVTGLSISQLWQKSYVHSTDDIKDADSTLDLDIESFNWRKEFNTSLSCSSDFASLNIVSFNKDKDCFLNNGTFEVQFSASGIEEISNFYPHLIYTGNSTQMRFLFKNLYSNSSHTRYALEIMKFHHHTGSCSDTRCKAIYTDSISDEFSPGVFSDVDLVAPCAEKDDELSFTRWRPVSYISSEPNVANSSDAQLTENCIESSTYHVRSIAELYFNADANSSASVFNITFGTQGDGFYQKTKYLSWSLMIGTGSPASNKLSVTAIVLVSIGLGALVLFLLTGAIFLSVQHCRKREDEVVLVESSTNHT